MDRAREGGYGEEVGRQGHPPNFVSPPSSEFSSEFSNAQNETHCIVEFTDDEPK